ncbi:winged helix-turn-helix domain-containing protein [Candidatus Pelagibacter communis]|uniref:winged helix-turn-helix domain-containing protein n=1 Tax=Pelagibacter ubique TaxID=198252 RepID=UPI00094DD466|nr:winged helix-turn-helix domain-containing protein [Candidatus Pelagibacter ubique]
MHRLNVLIYASNSFVSTLNELKPFLKFNHFISAPSASYDIILFHDEILKDKKIKNIINKSDFLKVCLSTQKNQALKCDAIIQLPTTLNEINNTLENIFAKKKFIKNSSIKVKSYLLNKNTKKLIKNNNSIILTEKEIQLIELLLNDNSPLSKNDILSSVWNYSAEADTHTVETHIYRLRKKINDEFMDDEFILNSKDGYHL